MYVYVYVLSFMFIRRLLTITVLFHFTYFTLLYNLIIYLHRLSAGNPTAEAAAKVYFQDLEDIFNGAVKKNGDVVLAAYKQSQTDLAAFKATLK